MKWLMRHWYDVGHLFFVIVIMRRIGITPAEVPDAGHG